MFTVTRSTSLSKEHEWRFWECVLFRFLFFYILLYHAPKLLQELPLIGSVLYWFSRSFDRFVYAMAGVDPPAHFTGSGDTFGAYMMQLVVVLLAIATSIVWSVLDRRRKGYARLHDWLRLLARYALAFALLAYAFSKIIPTQFLPLTTSQLAESYGDSSPMGLLWRFMGYSTAYTVFGGCAELLPAVLLLFRRTTLLGALLAFAVLLNVVFLNFCYDVPVKLYSVNLLLLAAFLILPETPRLYRIFVANASTRPSTLDGPMFHPGWIRTGAILLKFSAITVFIGGTIMSSIKRHRDLEKLPPPAVRPLTARGFHWWQEEPYNR